MPVIGSNLGRIGLTKTLLIQIIVLSFIAATLRGGLRNLTVLWLGGRDGERRPDERHPEPAAARARLGHQRL